MASNSIANQLNLSKERIQKVIYQAFLEQRILKYFQEESGLSERYIFADGKYIVPHFDDIVPGARGVAEGGTVPGATRITPQRMNVTLEKIMNIQEINWELTQVGKKDAFVNNQTDLIRQQGEKAIMDACNTVLLGYSLTGALAKIHSYSGTTMVLKRHDGDKHAASEPGARFIRKNQPINIIDSDKSTVNASGLTVSDRTDYQTIEVTGATAAVGDYVVPGDANGSQLGEVPTGMWQHLSDEATQSYQGLTNRGTDHPQLTGNVFSNSGTSRDLTSNLIWEALDAPLEKMGGDARHALIFGPPAICRNYADIFDDLYRFSPNDGPRNPSHRKATIPNQESKQISFELEYQSHPGRLYFIDPSCFKLLHNGQLYAFETNDAGGVLHRVQDAWAKDAYELRSRAYFQVPCEAPAKNSVITDINDAPRSGLF